MKAKTAQAECSTYCVNKWALCKHRFITPDQMLAFGFGGFPFPLPHASNLEPSVLSFRGEIYMPLLLPRPSTSGLSTKWEINELRAHWRSKTFVQKEHSGRHCWGTLWLGDAISSVSERMALRLCRLQPRFLVCHFSLPRGLSNQKLDLQAVTLEITR